MNANRAILTILILALGMYLVRGYMQKSEAEKVTAEAEVEKEKDDENGLSIRINDEEIALDGLEEAMSNLEESLKSLADGEEVETIDFRLLKEALPEKLVGLKKVSSSGEKSGIKGFMVSKAEARYEDEDRKLEIELMDTGGMALAQLGFAAWAKVEIDRESDDGYEKTYTKDDVRYHEEYNYRRESGSLKAIYHQRILLSLEVRNLKPETFQKILRKLDIGDLEVG